MLGLGVASFFAVIAAWLMVAAVYGYLSIVLVIIGILFICIWLYARWKWFSFETNKKLATAIVLEYTRQCPLGSDSSNVQVNTLVVEFNDAYGKLVNTSSEPVKHGIDYFPVWSRVPVEYVEVAKDKYKVRVVEAGHKRFNKLFWQMFGVVGALLLLMGGSFIIFVK